MIQEILNKLFYKVDIKVNGTPGAPIYLRRWFIWPRRPDNDKFVPRIYLHRFYTGDNVRDLHDHPWKFRSIILWGGYWEHSYNPEWKRWHALDNKKDDMIQNVNDLTQKQFFALVTDGLVKGTNTEPPKTIKKWFGPGSYLRRGAAWTHAVELSKDANGVDIPCWSLVRTGIKERSWGFHTIAGWCHWKQYHSGACVCYDSPHEDLKDGRASSSYDFPQVAGGHKQ